MTLRRQTPTEPAVTRPPGQAAVVLLLFLAALTGAVSPLPGRLTGAADAFPSSGSLAAAARRSGYLGLVVRQPGPVSPGQALRAIVRRRQLPVSQQTRLDGLLAGAPSAARPYLAEAFAAGHAVAEVAAFAAVITGHGQNWLRRHLRPVDPGESGPVEFGGNSFSQYDDTTCGSTTIVAARALVDPIYALQLTTGGRPGSGDDSGERFQQRLRAQEQRIHDETALLWPQPAGTPPWGITNLLDRHPADLGARYEWTAVVQAVPLLADAVIRRALTAVDRGYPVPVLIGDVIPRHYVLLMRHDQRGAWFYEPTAGEVVVVPAGDLRRRDFSELGFARLHGVILPSGPALG